MNINKIASAGALCTFLCSAITSQSAIWTSYLHVEAPGSPTAPSSTFAVTYDTDLFVSPTTITGADLLNMVYGAASPNGNYTDAFFSTNAYSTASSLYGDVSYIDFTFGSFVESFTIGGVNYAQDTDYDPSWAYFVAGGNGDNGGGFGTPGNYAGGAWTAAGDGIATRYLSDGSFDAWVLTSTDVSFNPIFTPTPTPDTGAFSGAIPINSIPEPSRSILLGLAVMLLVLRRNRNS